MKLPSLFTKTPQYKRFSYTPRFYDPMEEERKQREERIRQELRFQQEKETQDDGNNLDLGYRARIQGSFKSARKTGSRQSDPSASLIRLIIFTFLVIWIIAYIQFGSPAFYALLLFVPFYFYLKLKNVKRNDR